jgi:hypothetical protein
VGQLGTLKKILNVILRVLTILWMVVPFFLIGLLIGIFCYANRTDFIGLILLFLFCVGGLIAGLLVLKWFSKGDRANYIAGTNSSRDIDDMIKKDKK